MTRRQKNPLARHGSAPRRPIRYGPFARLADWWNATRDGHAGLPDVAADPPLTPTFEAHARTYDDRRHHEWKNVVVDTAELSRHAAQLEARISEIEHAALLVDKRLEALPEALSAADLEQRRGGEVDTDVAVVRLRRAREHEARRAPALQELAELRVELQSLRVELIQTRRAIRTRETVGAVRIRRLHAHTQRRLASYQRRLVRVHPDGPRLVPLLAPHLPTLPDWLGSLGDGPDTDA